MKLDNLSRNIEIETPTHNLLSEHYNTDTQGKMINFEKHQKNLKHRFF